MLWLARLDLVN